jgi:hypothetical protein
MAKTLSTSLFSIPYDGLLYAKGTDEFTAWKESYLVSDTMTTLEEFVAQRVVNRGRATYVDTKEGSYNLVFHFRFQTGGDVALRVPKPGHSALVAEKVSNEANWMKFFAEMTSIPVPKIHSFGTHAPDLVPRLELPFIIMDFLPGENLRQVLVGMSTPGTTGADDEKRDKIYEQIAKFYLQFYNLRLGAIGSVCEDISGHWAATRRPLTMDMHQLILGVSDFPTDGWPESSFEEPTDYLNFVVMQQRRQLWALRNLNIPRENDQSNGSLIQKRHGTDIDFEQAAYIARHRFLARLGFEKLAKHLCSVSSEEESEDEGSSGPFVPFNTDFDPRNMLVNAETGEITGLIDVEFTNAMPAAFARDPPLWLLGVGPEQCLEGDCFPWFRREYKPSLDHFVAAMKRVEEREGPSGKGKQLSELMLASWESGRVWFNFAANNIDQIDAIYWAVLRSMHPEGAEELELPPDTETDIESYVEHTKKQIELYEEEWEAIREC